MESCHKEINRKIKTKEKELKELKKLSSDLFNQIYKEDKKFKCLKNKKDPLCPECDFALPKTETGSQVQGLDFINYKWPKGMDEKLRILKTKGCLEWTKKEIFSACGCSGTFSCICGYTENYCMTLGTQNCPFCKRECKAIGSGRIYHELFKIT